MERTALCAVGKRPSKDEQQQCNDYSESNFHLLSAFLHLLRLPDDPGDFLSDLSFCQVMCRDVLDVVADSRT